MLLFTLIVLAQSAGPSNSRVTRVERVPGGRTVGGRSTSKAYAFTEFAPANGAGMGAPCACTTPTGAKGEVLTFTRASNGTCTKTATGGLSTTAIADGDLVVCTNNQPRVEYDGAGVLGLRVEAAATNSCLRSQEIDNAAWIPQNSGAALPIITANAATAPDGTLTADRVQIAACPSGSNFSLVQSSGSVQTTTTGSLYVRGVSGAGTLGLSVSSSGGPNGFLACAFVSTSWTRCVVSATGAAATTSIYFGCGNGVVNMTSTGAADVYVWQGDLTNVGHATSPIPTTSAAVTRAVDSASLAVASFSSAAGMSWGANVVHPSGNGGSVWASSTALIQDATNRTQTYRSNTNVQSCDYFSTAGNRSSAPVIAAYVAGQNYRQSCEYSGAGASSTISGYRDGVLTATSAAGTTGAITITSLFPGTLGPATSNSPADGIVSRVCLDPSLTRCR